MLLRRLFLLIVIFPQIHFCFAQSNFEPIDITGLWQCTKPGYDIVLEVSGGNGIVRSIGTTQLPKSIIGGFMYMNIAFDQVEKKLWNAQRNIWKTKADDPSFPASGRWVKGEMLKFKMTPDKNNFTAYGDLTFKRLTKRIDTKKEPDSKIKLKDCFTEDFDGVIGCFIVADNGLYAKFTYPSSDEEDHATLLIKTEDHVFQKITLDANSVYSSSFKGKLLEVQVLYFKGAREDNRSFSDKIIDFLKEKVRHQVTTDYLEIKSKKVKGNNPVFGIRG